MNDHEQVLDAATWRLEANAVVKDVEKHLKKIVVGDGSDQHIFFNLTTLENRDFCVELSAQGFRVVGTEYNQSNKPTEEVFETPYSLLSRISPSFHLSFGGELISKLNDLQNAS